MIRKFFFLITGFFFKTQINSSQKKNQDALGGKVFPSLGWSVKYTCLFLFTFLNSNLIYGLSAPTINAANTIDNDGDGQIDQILVTLSEAVADGSSTINNTSFTVAGYTVSNTTTGSSGNDNQLLILLSESGSADTDATPNVILVAGKISDGSSALGSNQTFTSTTDGAKPAILSAATGDANSDGTVDRLTLTFSESVVITDPGTDDHITLVASTGSASISAASYGTTASTLVYTITGATANNTSLTIAPTYATSGTGNITDASSNEMLNGETVSGTDGAKPAILSAATGDANSDGTVDRLTLTFSESVVITDPGTDDHITLVASTGSASISAASYGTTASTLVYTITGATANNTSLTIAPTYATSGTGNITDASSNEMLNGETVSGTDGAKPAILSAATGDANSDGTVDRLTLTFSESVVITDPGTDDHITLVASTGSASISAASYGTTASTLAYTITGATANNTSLTIAPTYATSGTGDITDASSNEMLNGETVSGTDGAKPAILSAATGDANSDGTVDRLTLTFSESVVITDPGTDDHITLVASTGSASISAASYGTTASTLAYTITGATANNTSLTIAPTYATSGTGDITDASSNEMLNGETVSGTDGAKPAILSAATGDANSDGTVDQIDVDL